MLRVIYMGSVKIIRRFTVTFISLILICSIFTIFTIAEEPSWWNDSWEYRQKLTIDNVGGTELTNYPAYVYVAYATAMQADFDDLRFTDNSGNLLDYEIESFVSSNHADCWIKLPSLSLPTTIIWMYYGNDSATNGQNPNSVWQDYVGVWHLNEETGKTTTKDSSGKHNGTYYGNLSMQIAGPYGNAQTLDGTGDKVEVPDSTDFDLTDYTLEIWINPGPVPDWAGMIVHSNNSGNANDFVLQFDATGGNGALNKRVQIRHAQNLWNTGIVFGDVTGDWHNIVVTRNGTTQTSYLDGIQKSSGTLNANPAGGSDPLRFGEERTGLDGNKYIGGMKEVRISNKPRSLPSIKQTYAMIYDNAAVVHGAGATPRPFKLQNKELPMDQISKILGFGKSKSTTGEIIEDTCKDNPNAEGCHQ